MGEQEWEDRQQKEDQKTTGSWEKAKNQRHEDKDRTKEWEQGKKKG